MNITFCGMDIDEQGNPWQAVDEINIWFDPLNRTRGPRPRGKARRLRGRRSPIRDKVKHGETGTLLARGEGDRADYCNVRTTRGKEGWVTFYFIEELKDEWLTQRKATRAIDRLQKDRRSLLNAASRSL